MESQPSQSPELDLRTALLSSDLAQEVRNEFLGQVGVGCTVASATRHVFSQFANALGDPQDGPVIILAVAALQWAEGGLTAMIRDAAVDLIESGEAMAAYKSADYSVRDQRKQLLKQFAETLTGIKVVESD